MGCVASVLPVRSLSPTISDGAEQMERRSEMRDGEKEERTSAGSPPPLPGETGEPSFPAVAAAAGGLDDGDAVETRLGI